MGKVLQKVTVTISLIIVAISAIYWTNVAFWTMKHIGRNDPREVVKIKETRGDFRKILAANTSSSAEQPSPPEANLKPPNQNDYGYVLATHFADQMTAGSVNLLSLQCWASTLGDRVRVVSPFLRERSHLGFESSLLQNVDSREEKGGPRIHDIFDAQAWNYYASHRSFAPLASWEEFLLKAPKSVILVGSACANLPQSFKDTAASFFLDSRFKIVREVCTERKGVISAAEFRGQVYGRFQPQETVVLFDVWKGIQTTLSPSYRLNVTNLSRCERGRNINFMDFIPLSRRIAENGRTYVKKYLHSNNGYAAVMFRLEQVFVQHGLKSAAEGLDRGTRCVKGILREVKKLKKIGMKKVFLAMDAGKYGSFTILRNANTSVVTRLSHDLFNGLYRYEPLTYEKWEGSFGSVADFTKAGYVAMLQLHVAMHARFLLLAGGGSFQSIAERSIKYRHASNARINRIKEC